MTAMLSGVTLIRPVAALVWRQLANGMRHDLGGIRTILETCRRIDDFLVNILKINDKKIWKIKAASEPMPDLQRFGGESHAVNWFFRIDSANVSLTSSDKAAG
ncbi:hypothetical protein [Lutimaribacter pacificus]|uniref:hypothetical protein n=1 Tax=Lutimaribacter pacificus TaxID=391948 RepID=UPI001CB7FBCA|nr:hypothetical protein [Lutimaribacter pacificus]